MRNVKQCVSYLIKSHIFSLCIVLQVQNINHQIWMKLIDLNKSLLLAKVQKVSIGLKRNINIIEVWYNHPLFFIYIFTLLLYSWHIFIYIYILLLLPYSTYIIFSKRLWYIHRFLLLFSLFMLLLLFYYFILYYIT